MFFQIGPADDFNMFWIKHKIFTWFHPFIYFSCYFDGVKGEVANLLFTTVPLTLILTINVVLYFMTWRRIKQEEPKFKGLNGREARVVRASHRAARTMSLFVTAFMIQWWAMSAYGIVQVSSNIEVPIELFQFVTTFSNVGGILNGIVYYVIRRRSKERHSESGNSLDISRSDGGKKFTRMHASGTPPIELTPTLDSVAMDNGNGHVCGDKEMITKV